MAACARAWYGPGKDPTMDDCSAIMKLMDAHLDGELGVKESIRVQTHVQGCSDCRETVLVENAFRDLVRKQAAPTPAPDSTRRSISAALARERTEKETEKRQPISFFRLLLKRTLQL
jgi:mycothiol system anti-sigma-R factor